MILVTGGSGMLGCYVTELLIKKQIAFVAPSRQELDLGNLDKIAVYLNTHNFSAIFHFAAETNVDLCEQDPAHAMLINTVVTQKLAEYAKKHDIPLIFISTSAVFGGIPKLTYCELDIPTPLSHYGSSKYWAEQYISAHCARHIIIRSSFMVGGGPLRDKKFIAKILPKLQKNETVSVVYDKIGSLTYAYDMANFIVENYSYENYGIMHVASSNSCSRYDVIKLIANRINSQSEIKKVSSQLFPLAAPRPMSEALYSVSPFVNQQYTWEQIINEYLKEWV